MHCKLYILLHTSQSLSSLTSAILSLSPRIMQMFPSFPFMPFYLGMRHLLKLDIFLTSVRQSLTELHEGAAIRILGKQLNRNKIRHWECLVDRQTFFFLLDVCNNWISTEQFLYHEDGLKSCCLKNTAGLFLLHRWLLPSLGNPNLTSEVLFLYTVLLNIEHCIRFIEKLLFDLLLFLFCRIHVHWHHIVSKNPDESCFKQTSA